MEVLYNVLLGVVVYVVAAFVLAIASGPGLGQFFRMLWHSIIGNPVNAGLLVLAVAGVTVFLSSRHLYDDGPQFWDGVAVEAHGMIMDIIILGIFVLWLNRRGQNRALIQSYRDEIDDFKGWKESEAVFTTVGNIRRLNRNKITKINLVDSYLEGVNLRRANLGGADLRRANFGGADLRRANFGGADLRRAELCIARLCDANLRGADLRRADLGGADLVDADFRGAWLRGANLRGANLRGATLLATAILYHEIPGADLAGAVYSPSTQFPDNFNPDDHGMILVEDDSPNQQTSTTTKPNRVETLPSYYLPC